MSRLATAILMLVALVGFTAPPVNAATGEEACFCYLNDTGATKVPASTGQSCQEACAQMVKYAGYLWATDYAQYPASNLRCFADADQCAKDMDGDGTIDGEFGSEQPPECLPGSHYCYSASSIKTTLQVSIPDTQGNQVTTVDDFGQYIGTVYNYLLGFALTLAIVFMMVGGIRYVIGASSGEIGKAKDMIVKAVSGFVLLLFAWVILYTVNPQLIRLEVPKLPMLKGVAFTEGDDCGTLLGSQAPNANPKWITNDSALTMAASSEYGSGARASKINGAVITFSTANPVCGEVAEILRDAKGNEVPDGTTCKFDYCADSIDRCLTVGTKGMCKSCKEVFPGNDLGAVPNAAICSGLDPEDKLIPDSTEYELYNACGYTHSPSLVSSGVGIVTGAVLTAFTGVGGALYAADVVQASVTGTCASLNIDCKTVSGCSGYNSLQVTATTTGGVTDNELDDLDYPSIPGLGTNSPTIIEICSQDPCREGAKMTPATTCAYNESTGDCQVADYASPAPTPRSGLDEEY